MFPFSSGRLVKRIVLRLYKKTGYYAAVVSFVPLQTHHGERSGNPAELRNCEFVWGAVWQNVSKIMENLYVAKNSTFYG